MKKNSTIIFLFMMSIMLNWSDIDCMTTNASDIPSAVEESSTVSVPQTPTPTEAVTATDTSTVVPVPTATGTPAPTTDASVVPVASVATSDSPSLPTDPSLAAIETPDVPVTPDATANTPVTPDISVVSPSTPDSAPAAVTSVIAMPDASLTTAPTAPTTPSLAKSLPKKVDKTQSVSLVADKPVTEKKEYLPQGTLPGGFQVIAAPAKMVKVDIGRGGKNPLAVALDDAGNGYTLNNDYNSWKKIDTGNIKSAPGNIPKNFMDLLPNGTVVAIRVVSEGTWQGKYLTLAKPDEEHRQKYYITATGTSADDATCQFIIKRSTKHNWIGFTHAQTKGINLQSDDWWVHFDNKNFDEPNHDKEQFALELDKPNRLDAVKIHCDQNKKGYLTITPGGKTTVAGQVVANEDQKVTRNDELSNQPAVTFAVEIINGTTQFGMDQGTASGSLKDISIGTDGTIWAITTGNAVIKYSKDGWQQVDGTGSTISVGNCNEVWITDNDNQLWRKKDPDHDSHSWTLLPGSGTTISCGGDGIVWLPGSNLQLQRLDRYGKKWVDVIRPADFRMDNPKQVKIADQFTIVFLDYANTAWQLQPGKGGTQGSDWTKIPGETKLKNVSIGRDNTLIGITMDDKIILRHPDEKDDTALNQGRGSEIRGGQIVKITTGSNWGYRPVWTDAASAYDPNGTKQPPEDHFELLVSKAFPTKLDDPKGDYRFDTASFITITHNENPASTDPIKYGDIIEIFSLYAAPGNESKAGVMGKSRLWWSHNDHFKYGKGWNDILVTTNAYPKTQDGSQLFKIMSPEGKTGFVRSQDIVEIESLASTSKNRKAFVDNWSRLGDSFKELLIPSTQIQDTQSNSTYFWGARDTSGDQHFQLHAINSPDEVPKTAKTPPDVKDKNLSVSAQDVFNKLAETGQFWQASKALAQEQKTALETKVTNGIGVIKEIRNQTPYPIETDDLGEIPIEDAVTGLTRKLLTKLTISGFAEDAKIDDFGPQKMIQLKKMFSRGFAWVEESLEEPGKTTITFLARATDKGGIEIDFATKMGTSAEVKIIIGAEDNTKSQIIYEDPTTGKQLLVSEADARFNPLAKAAPGKFVPYWVSIHDGFIMVGTGQPGESIFLSGFLPEPIEVNRYAFSSNDAGVDYSEIQTAKSLLSLAQDTIYAKLDTVLDIAADIKGKPTYLTVPIRVSNETSFSFEILAQESGTAVFANDKGETYKIIIGANKNNNLIIQKNKDIVLVQNTSMLKEAHLNEKTPTKFWITLVGGQILVGHGELGNNLLLAWEDSNQLLNIKRFGFAPSGFAQKISNITAAPPVTIGTEDAEVVYKAKLARTEYSGSMTVIRPFEYEIAQIEESVKLKNLLTGRLFPVLGTPQQGALYEFRLTIDATGLPSVDITNQPQESPAKMELERGAMEDEIQGDLKASLKNADAMLSDAMNLGLSQAANTFIQGAQSQNTFIAGATTIAAGALSASAIAAAAAAGQQRKEGATEQAQLKAQASEKQVQAQFAFQGLDSYVLSEQPTNEAAASASVPQEAITNRQTIQGELDQTLTADWTNPDQIKILIRVYQDIVNRINHPYVLQDSALKKRIMGDLEKFTRTITDDLASYQDIIGLLVGAVTNGYLIDKNESTDVDAKERWYNAVAELGDILLKNGIVNPANEITIPPLWGMYLWFPGQMTNGQAELTFQAQGQHDLFICFSQDITDVRNSDEPLYEVDLGGFNNKKTVIRIKSLGRSADETTNKDLMLQALRPKTYWVAFDNGTIYLGSGQTMGQNIIEKWQDPYPWKNIQYIGIGSWDAPVKISQLSTTWYTPDQAQVDLGGSAPTAAAPATSSTAQQPAPAQTGAPVGA